MSDMNLNQQSLMGDVLLACALLFGASLCC